MPAQRTAPHQSKKTALISSSVVLRGVATVITLSSLGGMTSFAATHVQNAAAPLQPSASATTAAATPAATAPTSTRTRRSTTITGATTTTTTARTQTKSS